MLFTGNADLCCEIAILTACLCIAGAIASKALDLSILPVSLVSAIAA